ncbi:hypothetical protein EV356DRAFT_578502 [Viridothelium virens]|uniref:Uncharacterized protein n=1 Tax=Viridothelium virens TaxID=1048519 RepID=A0A6A6H2F1_VIRVR|nr:hypothetical protein EV356DRAFT_578502 [Viridothelium virens]
MATSTHSNPGPPRRIPKLKYRNPISENGSHVTANANAPSSSRADLMADGKATADSRSVSTKDSLEISESGSSTASGKDSGSLHRQETKHSDFRPSTARTGCSDSSASKSEGRNSKKKKSSMLDFLSLKEPSTRAFEEFAEQERRKAAVKGNGSTTTLPGVSSQKLPATVPKVNSKWDGMPRESEAAKARRQALRRDSTSTIGRSFKSHSQTSLSHSLETSRPTSTKYQVPSNSQASSLRGSDEKSSIISTTYSSSDSGTAPSTPVLKYPDLIKPTPGALSIHSLSTLKTPSMPSLPDPSSYFASNRLAVLDNKVPGSDSSEAQRVAEHAIRHDFGTHERSPSDEYRPNGVIGKSWPSKPLHSPSGSQDAHIHPALRESGKIYESESSNSSSEILSRNGSGLSTPRSPMTPTDLAPLEEELSETNSMHKSVDSDKTELAENWPLPGPGAEPAILPSDDDQAGIAPISAKSETSPSAVFRDSGYEESERAVPISPGEKRVSGQSVAFNFSRRDSVRPPRKTTPGTAKNPTQEPVVEEELSSRTEAETSHFSPGDHHKSIHLGIGFDTDDIASIAESQAPSEMSERWFKAPKERLGLGSLVLKKDALTWGGEEDERYDKKRRFPVPLFHRG